MNKIKTTKYEKFEKLVNNSNGDNAKNTNNEVIFLNISLYKKSKTKGKNFKLPKIVLTNKIDIHKTINVLFLDIVKFCDVFIFASIY
jgi:hypothetical protein